MDKEKTVDGALKNGKQDVGGHPALGLHDLYKAAFSEEYKKEDNAGYDVYPLKPLTFANDHEECFSANPPVVSYEIYESNENDSVLDLDRGVPVHVSKVSLQNAPYNNQLLQRYLHDASITILKNEPNEQSGSSSENVTYNADSNREGSHLGINPEQFGVTIEDCDFNSSDSFASTESIIPKTIKCLKCPKMFMFKSDLTRHTRHKHTTKQKLLCRICSKEFNCQQNLSFHIKSHKTGPNLNCHICKTDFESANLFSKHMEERHQVISPFRCSICPKAYRKVKEYLTHQKKHYSHQNEDESTFECPKCLKIFDRKSSLASHMKTHIESTPFACSSCNKTFKKKSSLQKHSKTHIVLVAATTSSAGDLSSKHPTASVPLEYMVLPSGQTLEKVFKCIHCLSVFAQEDVFKIHVASHGTMLCPQCGNVFATKEELVEHQKNHLNRRKRLKCSDCKESFLSKKKLDLHMAAAHKRSTQESFTQTSMYELQNVNFTLEPGSNIHVPEDPVFLTSLNTIPVILTAPSAVPVPYSVSS